MIRVCRVEIKDDTKHDIKGLFVKYDRRSTEAGMPTGTISVVECVVCDPAYVVGKKVSAENHGCTKIAGADIDTR